MRRKWLYTAIVVVVLLVTTVAIACGGEESAEPANATSAGETTTSAANPETSAAPETSTTDTAPETTTTEAAGVAKYGDTVSFWDQEITLGLPELWTGEMFADESMDMYRFLVTMVNNGSEAKPYNTLYFECQDTESFTYNSVMMLEQQDLGSGDLQPGKTVKGYIAFEVPKGGTVASVSYVPMVFGLDEESVTWEQ